MADAAHESGDRALQDSYDAELFVPGRVCLLGEHSDWSGSHRRFNSSIAKGCNIVCGTTQGLYARVRYHPSKLILSSTNESGERKGPVEFDMDPDVLLEEARAGGFWSYACGVACRMLTDYHIDGLVVDNYRTTLPLKKGLSSSAALCVLMVRAFKKVYDLKMTVRGEMEYAFQGEIMTPSRCGRMDQACAYGSVPVRLEYDGDHLSVNETIVDGEFHVLLVDLQAQKDTVEILSCLQAAYPFAKTEKHRGLHKLLGEINQNIIDRAQSALATGDAPRLGALMIEAQTAFDKYAAPLCPQQLTAPVLHKVLSYPAIQRFVYGGKGVGAGYVSVAYLVKAWCLFTS